jgi:hypothetical protein
MMAAGKSPFETWRLKMEVRHPTWPRLGAFALGLLLAVSPGLVSPAQAQAQKPNIVLIVSDDFGYGDSGPYGGARAAACRRRRSIASPTKA